ncbi:MAG: hypothetical protein PHP59_02355 [Methanofollis sp.]|uniref:hypothetical protein n=1 Tax=Methanofollis sp. TaxID=2052835 RepID=UPI00263758BB|nr:hypothetical protein [Methanofollis sp.]MDD4254199.1 hypothetical protein [Methanofollis sp.]
MMRPAAFAVAVVVVLVYGALLLLFAIASGIGPSEGAASPGVSLSALWEEAMGRLDCVNETTVLSGLEIRMDRGVPEMVTVRFLGQDREGTPMGYAISWRQNPGMETSLSPAAPAGPGLHPLILLSALDELDALDYQILIRAGPERKETTYDLEVALLENGSFLALDSVVFPAETTVCPVTFLRQGDARPFLTAFLRDDLLKAKTYAFTDGDGHAA